MINTYKKLTIATLICNLLIIVGFGHGIAPLALFELFGIANGFYDLKFSMSFSRNYEDTLFVAAIFSMFGQLCLIISIANEKRLLKLIGIVLLWIGFCYLIHNIVTSDPAAGIGLIFGLPFLVLSIVLFVFIVKTDDVQPEEE